MAAHAARTSSGTPLSWGVAYGRLDKGSAAEELESQWGVIIESDKWTEEGKAHVEYLGVCKEGVVWRVRRIIWVMGRAV